MPQKVETLGWVGDERGYLVLIDQTRLPMAQVALAAGFGSIRRFNETFQRLYGRPPSTLRRGGAGDVVRTGDVSILLPYRPPYDLTAMLAFLGARAIPGVEAVTCDTYTRTIAVGIYTLVETGREEAAWSLLLISALLAFGAIYLSNRLVSKRGGL